MKKRNLRDLLRYRRYSIIGDYDDTAQTLKNLELAWSNLPEDMSDDERSVFIELVEDVVRLHNRLESTYSASDIEKN